ncbi:sec-independent protein translocase protein TatB [Arboricoccus pini]|uniref:Sec-independent protein translocase protein TatB n=1 Tax=Arboricoccus pini TaxID=1963835 RepID=A0A212QPZ2_9PROT|nr:Sec-independent protein translocase protein TatB [Arboricoccus pini]SNB61534.1 sec-independent protein translocase protein TatB [Arboricoccus pini]
MLDMSWSEILVIMVVALIVIGPKDLPKVIREVGKWTGKARSIARDFQRSFDDMVREAELDEIRQSLDKARPSNLKNTIRDMVDPDGELKRAFDLKEGPAKPVEGAPKAEASKAIEAGPPEHLPGSPPPETVASDKDPTIDAPRYQPAAPDKTSPEPEDTIMASTERESVSLPHHVEDKKPS